MSDNKPTYQELEKLVAELRSKNELKQIEDRFKMLLNASEDMITIHKPDGEYLYYNGPTSYAITPEEIVGKMPADLFNSEVSTALHGAFEKVQKTGASETVEVLLDWLGEKRWFSEYIYPVKNTNGEAVELVKVCRDIHQRKIGEQEIETQNKALIIGKEALDHQNQKLHELNDALNQAQKLSHVGSWEWEMATDRAEWSDEMYNIYGVTKGRFYPSSENVLKTVLSEDLHKMEEGVNSLLTDKTFVPFEFRIRRPSGEIRNLYIVSLEHKTQDSIFGVTKDITEQKKAELELSETNKSLEELVYIASHDLQVPLVSIEGYATQLLETYAAKFDEDGTHCLTRLQANARRMHALVLSLLDVSRLNTKKYPYEKINLDLLLEKTLLDIALTVEKHNATVDVGKMPELFADQIRIESVFRNLIINSIIYGAKNISLGYENNTVFVKDDGIGIPESQLERIFNPGERLKKNNAEGVGMGLTFCKKVIEQHKGKIWAKSDGENNGTTMFIQLTSNN
jgi:PAS domain S-box-containing protein